MLTAAVLSGNPESCGALQVNLQQTGLVHTVRGWTGPLLSHPSQGEGIPDLVLLDIDTDPSGFFAAAANLRRLKPDSSNHRLLADSTSGFQHASAGHEVGSAGVCSQARRSGNAARDVTAIYPGTGSGSGEGAAETDCVHGFQGRRGNEHDCGEPGSATGESGQEKSRVVGPGPARGPHSAAAGFEAPFFNPRRGGKCGAPRREFLRRPVGASLDRFGSDGGNLASGRMGKDSGRRLGAGGECGAEHE